MASDTPESQEIPDGPDTGINTVEDALLYLARSVPADHYTRASLERVLSGHFGTGETSDPQPPPNG